MNEFEKQSESCILLTKREAQTRKASVASSSTQRRNTACDFSKVLGRPVKHFATMESHVSLAYLHHQIHHNNKYNAGAQRSYARNISMLCIKSGGSVLHEQLHIPSMRIR